MGGAISSIFGGGGKKEAPTPIAPPPPPTIDNSKAAEDAARSERARRVGVGRASTQITSGEGLAKDDENSYVSGRKKLLG